MGPLFVNEHSRHISCLSPPSSDVVFSPTGTESSMASSSLSLTDTSLSVGNSLCREGDCTSPNDKKERKGVSWKKKKKKKKKKDIEVADDHKKHIKESLCVESPTNSKKVVKRSRWRCNRHEACCTCAGAFAADCAAICCCPCAIFPLIAFILIELPSALATKMISHLKVRRLHVKRSLQPICSNNDGDRASTNFTPSGSFKEPHDATEGEAHIIRFDTQNLLKHFEAENVGFGCLSQKRE